MNINLILASLIIVFFSNLSANAQVKSATGFIGECIRKIGDLEDRNYCDSNIVNLNFQDGYISFQFNSKEKLKNGRYKESISFVGPGLAKQQKNGKEIVYLPVEQLTLGDGRKTKLETKKGNNSVCLLGFSNNDLKPENLEFLQCHYQEGGKVILYKASNLRIQELGGKSDDEEKARLIGQEDILCDKLPSYVKSKLDIESLRDLLTKIQIDKKIDLGRPYIIASVTCECKMRNTRSVLSAIDNILGIDRKNLKYNVPMNDKPTHKSMFSYLGENHHTKEWTDRFNKWILDDGPIPETDDQGNPACSLVTK